MIVLYATALLASLASSVASWLCPLVITQVQVQSTKVTRHNSLVLPPAVTHRQTQTHTLKIVSIDIVKVLA